MIIINPVTVAGFKILSAELADLLNCKMPNCLLEIKEHREKGDLSENAEYHAARQYHNEVARRAKALQNFLQDCQQIDCRNYKANQVVLFGCIVHLHSDSDKVQYKIVNTLELPLFDDSISIHSPLAKSVIGKKVGDTFHLNESAFKVCRIEYT